MAGQRVGYVRVSTLDQRTDRQLDGVELDRVFTDKASGKDVVRPQLDALLAFVRDGDTVVVHSMDRLARNLDDLRRLVRALTGKGVRVQFVTEHLFEPGRQVAGGVRPCPQYRNAATQAAFQFDQALLLEQHDSLADRRCPAVVALGQFGHGSERGAGAELAGHDVAGDGLGKAFALARARHSHSTGR